MTSDPWHYPRGELAVHILDVLNSGVVSRIAIFAPRRKGKTWFVLRDLSPAAIKRSYIPVFASLWLNADKPQVAIIEALELAVTTLDKPRIPWTDYLGKLASASVNIAGFGGGVGLKRAEAPSAEDLATIAKLLNQVVQLAAKKKRHVLLLIDEAQHLATNPAFESLAKALRTAIEGIEATDASALRTLFTGSSRTDLAALLQQKNAAFYDSFDRQELPDLSREYTDFVHGQLRRLGNVRVGKDALWSAFEELQCSPYHMQAIVRELMLKRAKTLADAKEIVLDGIRHNPELTARWHSLNPLEQALFVRVAQKAPLYTQQALDAVKKSIGEPVKASQVQNATRQLAKKGVIAAVDRAEYQIEDGDLLAWWQLQPDI